MHESSCFKCFINKFIKSLRTIVQENLEISVHFSAFFNFINLLIFNLNYFYNIKIFKKIVNSYNYFSIRNFDCFICFDVLFCTDFFCL